MSAKMSSHFSQSSIVFAQQPVCKHFPRSPMHGRDPQMDINLCCIDKHAEFT